MSLRYFLWLYLLLTASCHAEGFFRASVEEVDDSAWPEIRILLKVVDEAGDEKTDYTSLPNVYSALDCPQGQCWDAKLTENGVPVEVTAQESSPIAPRSQALYLWLRYKSNRETLDNIELQVALRSNIGAGSNYSAVDQEPLYPGDVVKSTELERGPWRYLARLWDRRLNEAYQALRSSLPEDALGALTAAQRSWILFRDAYCDGLTDGPSGDRLSRCLALRSLERGVELHDRAIRLAPNGT